MLDKDELFLNIVNAALASKTDEQFKQSLKKLNCDDTLIRLSMYSYDRTANEFLGQRLDISLFEPCLKLELAFEFIAKTASTSNDAETFMATLTKFGFNERLKKLFAQTYAETNSGFFGKKSPKKSAFLRQLKLNLANENNGGTNAAQAWHNPAPTPMSYKIGLIVGLIGLALTPLMILGSTAYAAGLIGGFGFFMGFCILLLTASAWAYTRLGKKPKKLVLDDAAGEYFVSNTKDEVVTFDDNQCYTPIEAAAYACFMSLQSKVSNEPMILREPATQHVEAPQASTGYPSPIGAKPKDDSLSQEEPDRPKSPGQS